MAVKFKYNRHPIIKKLLKIVFSKAEEVTVIIKMGKTKKINKKVDAIKKYKL